MTTGERIKELRVAREMTQQDLADRIGVTKSAVSIWELDKQMASIDKLEMLCGIFNVSMDYILGREDISPLLLTAEERRVTESYRNQSDKVKDFICKALDVKRDAEFMRSLRDA